MVLLAVCDANSWFILIDFGHCGSNNDCGITSNSGKREAFGFNEIDLPEPKKLCRLKECRYDPLTYDTLTD